MKTEKIDRKLTIVLQPSLYKQFKEKSKNEYKTVSIKIRELMLNYIKKKIK
jgi:hypothetical protein